MTRVLVAGVGNLFFGDDGFGVEVARRLAVEPPPDTRVADFGIRAVHLAYDLLAPPELLVVADCVARGGAPGTLYVIEPEVETGGSFGDAHTLDLSTVFATLRQLGGVQPRTLLVGCEPDSVDAGIGLSRAVRGAIPAAIDLIRDLITSRQESP